MSHFKLVMWTRGNFPSRSDLAAELWNADAWTGSPVPGPVLLFWFSARESRMPNILRDFKHEVAWD